MNISKLVAELEAIKAEHGDILVTILENSGDASVDYEAFSGLLVVNDYCWNYDVPEDGSENAWCIRLHVRLHE